jgi:hypothetical protein
MADAGIAGAHFLQYALNDRRVQHRSNDMAELSCWNCGTSLDDLPRPISRHANCPQCFTEVHCCRMCRHYDVKATEQCQEERAEPPTNKEVANFCEWFEPRTGAYRARRTDAQDRARAKLDALFGGSSSGETDPADETDSTASDAPNETRPMTKEEEARAKLEALFKK